MFHHCLITRVKIFPSPPSPIFLHISIESRFIPFNLLSFFRFIYSRKSENFLGRQRTYRKVALIKMKLSSLSSSLPSYLASADIEGYHGSEMNLFSSVCRARKGLFWEALHCLSRQQRWAKKNVYRHNVFQINNFLRSRKRTKGKKFLPQKIFTSHSAQLTLFCAQ